VNSKKMREDPLFMRNEYPATGKWEIPVIKKQQLDISDIRLIACSDTRANDCSRNRECGVHFFVDDYRFSGIYDHPYRSLEKYSQYKFLLSPDFSTYSEMQLWRQLENVARNRWCGAFWQKHGITVIPTVSWGLARSYEFCFTGIEKGSMVAVGMIGCKSEKLHFLRGYNEMMNRIEPEAIICFGTPFNEMEGNIIPVDYIASRKVVR